MRKFKSLTTVCLFAAGAVLFGLLAPSIMGLAMLALLVAIPLAVLAGAGWFLWSWLRSIRKPALAQLPELEAEQQTA